ncbi:recombination protein NinB [Bradyrhizobium sp. 2]|uniref:recombination protein NinB n=1 Tax=Bradyrhizobium sp. 2 TaxID=190045 RepID=UPI002096A7B9|nr:recombination protein NinB [Bradyrhizobium sp. 2]
MWVALTELATQLKWHGEKLTPDEWKILFMDALTREMRVVPSIDGLASSVWGAHRQIFPSPSFQI